METPHTESYPGTWTEPAAPRWTPEEQRRLVEWLSLPDNISAELLGGRIVHKAMARGDHGAAQGVIFGQYLKQHGRGGPGTRWWLTLEVDVYLSGEGMRPDVAGWRVDKHPAPPLMVNVQDHLGVIVTPPDWVCEVLSTSTASRDKGVKRKAYQRAGVEWYWLMDLLAEELRVYRCTQRSYELIETAYDGDVVRLPPFEEADFAVGPVLEYKRARLAALGGEGGSRPMTTG